jgi:hypothetical protein
MTRTHDTELVAAGRSCWKTLETIHVVGYFAPEPTQEYVDLGLHPRLSYFAARSAPIGPVVPGVTTATFYVFAPWLVDKAISDVWEVASPAQVLDARHRGTAAALHRVLGDPDLDEALKLVRGVCAGLSTAGRPLYAAHAGLPWPDDDLLALWHGASLIREHRGDGHVALLQAADLDPVESLVLGGLHTGNTDFVRQTRGWSDEEWAHAEQRLRDRGLLTDTGELSSQGRDFRQDLEDRTDALAVEGWAAVGTEATARLRELVVPLARQVLDSGVLPGWANPRRTA